jgi:serine/threonine protein phosphatase PrpC
MNTLQVYQEHQVELDRLHDIQIELAGGTTAVVGLVYQGNLYVANVGDSRALLCTSDEAGNLYVQVLSVDHTPKNPNEIARLASLGLDVELLTRGKRMAGLEHTRSIGDYALKGGYKDFDIISMATSEPVVADPHVVGPIPLGQSVSFLVLMSDGVYNSLEEALPCPDVNNEIARLVSEELYCNSTVTSAAQAVVDKICRLHYDFFMETGKVNGHGDMMLLIRNFNHGMKCRKFSSASTASSSSRDTIELSRDVSFTSSGGFVRPVAVPYSETSSSSATPSLYIPERNHFQGLLSGGANSDIRLIPVSSPQYSNPYSAGASTLYPDDPFTPVPCSSGSSQQLKMATPLLLEPTRLYPCTTRQPPSNSSVNRSDTFCGDDVDPSGRTRAALSGPMAQFGGKAQTNLQHTHNHFVKGHRRVPSDPASVGRNSPHPPHRRQTDPEDVQAMRNRGMHKNTSYPFLSSSASNQWRKKSDQKCAVRGINEEYGALTRQYSDPTIAGQQPKQGISSPRAQTPDINVAQATSGQSRTSTPSSGMSPYHTPPSPSHQASTVKQAGMGGSVDSGISNMEESDQEQRPCQRTCQVKASLCMAESEDTLQASSSVPSAMNQQEVPNTRQTDVRGKEADSSGRIVGYLDFSDIHVPAELVNFFDKGHCQ